MNRTYIAYQNRMKYIINIILIFGTLILSRYFQIQIFGIDDFQQNFQKKLSIQKTLKENEEGYTIVMVSYWLAI